MRCVHLLVLGVIAEGARGSGEPEDPGNDLSGRILGPMRCSSMKSRGCHLWFQPRMSSTVNSVTSGRCAWRRTVTSTVRSKAKSRASA